jgi:hypothetical protein
MYINYHVKDVTDNKMNVLHKYDRKAIFKPQVRMKF